MLAHLDRAERFRAWLDEEPSRTAADLARREGLTRARVCQLLALLDLPAEIVTDLRRPDRTGRVPTELQARAVAREPDCATALVRYRQLIANDERGVPKQAGFQHLLARARRYQAMLDEGRHWSISSIARAEGLSVARVARWVQIPVGGWPSRGLPG